MRGRYTKGKGEEGKAKRGVGRDVGRGFGERDRRFKRFVLIVFVVMINLDVVVIVVTINSIIICVTIIIMTVIFLVVSLVTSSRSNGFIIVANIDIIIITVIVNVFNVFIELQCPL